MFREPPSKAMQLRINDYTSRQGVLLSQPRYPQPPDDLFEQEEADGDSVEEGSGDDDFNNESGDNSRND